jgi:hypothetical protein
MPPPISRIFGSSPFGSSSTSIDVDITQQIKAFSPFAGAPSALYEYTNTASIQLSPTPLPTANDHMVFGETMSRLHGNALVRTKFMIVLKLCRVITNGSELAGSLLQWECK